MPTSAFFQRVPEFILKLAFQEGYCIFSINAPLNPLSFCFKFSLAGPDIFYLFIPFHLYSVVIFVAITFRWHVRHDTILFAPKWQKRLIPGISIAPYPWLLSHVLSKSSLVFFISVSIVLLQVPRRRPLFLLPLSGVHLNAVRAMLSRSIFITCPSHLHLLCFVTVVMFLWWSFLFEIIWGLYILHIVLRHEVWKPDNLWLSLWVPLQHSAPYSSILIRRCCNRSLLFFFFHWC